MSEKQEITEVLQANAHFTKDLYNILAVDPGNVFFSPISAHSALSMSYQAARGATKDAFSASLHVPEPAVAAEGYSSVMSLLNNTPDIQLHIANKIYVMEGHELFSAFKDIVQNKFFSEIEHINFGNKVQAAEVINSWVKRKTNNKIKNVVSPNIFDHLSRALLVNAIYFKGDWLHKFDPSQTQTEKFYLNDKETSDCQMMFKKCHYMLKQDQALDAKVLEIPYKNKDLSLIVILPNERNGINDLEAKLTETDLTKITEGMHQTTVNVKLPKFKIETTINLKDPLKKIGLGIIFVPGKADFSGMIDSPELIYVSEAFQKAFIEVNEEGAEAAAATGIKKRVIRKPRPPKEFYADHPFIIILQVRHGNMSGILFNGRVSQPKY